jgi:hypothetical protein
MTLNLNPLRTLLFIACTAPLIHATSTTQVTINTSSLAGQTENLVFDFDLGGGTQLNSVDITHFFTDGTLSSLYQGGNAGVTGGLPGNLTFTTGTTVVEEFYVTEVLGDTISFDFDSTNNAPTANAFPDEFDVYLLDPASSSEVLPSTDPSGAGSLLAVDLVGYSGQSFSDFSSDLTLGSPTVPTTPTTPATATPEPACLFLLGLALLAVGSRTGRTAFQRLFRHSQFVTPVAALVLASALVPALHAQTYISGVGVDSNIAVTFSGLRNLHSANTFVSVATIYNASPLPVSGPFYLGVSGTGGPVYLVNSSGQMPDGTSGYQITTPASLNPGQSASVNVSFSDPSNKTFTITAKVWDASSTPPTPVLQCPQGVTAPGLAQAIVSAYTIPTDNLGRTASCVPAAGTVIETYGPTGTCTTHSPNAPTASCSFPVSTPNIAPAPIIISGTTTINYATETTIALIPCTGLAGFFTPAQVASLPSDEPLYYSCDAAAAGTTAFSVYNYGPFPAKNFTVTMKVPPGPSGLGWRFTLPDTCASPVPQSFTITLPLVPTVTVPNGSDITCTFAELDPYQAMTGFIGLDVPSGGASTNVPAVELDLALDPTQNFTHNTDEMSARVTMNPGTQSITVPASISVKSQPCDYSQSPGFAILLNTCGVPPVVNEILVGVAAGVVTVVTGGAGAFLDISDFNSLTIFNFGANQGGKAYLLR